MDTLKALLRGEYIDLLYAPTKNKEYLRFSKEFDEEEKSFLETLNEEQKNAYFKCVTLLLCRENFTAEIASEKAFTLGAQMMCEILSGYWQKQ